jgi:hypothetical protein
MVQAAAEGVIDFAQADPRDNWWWRKVQLLIDQLESKNLRQLATLDVQKKAAQLSRPISSEDAAVVMEKLFESAELVQSLLFPWHKLPTKDDIVTEARDLWTAVWGDPNSPETKEMMAKALAAMKAPPKPT